MQRAIPETFSNISSESKMNVERIYFMKEQNIYWSFIIAYQQTLKVQGKAIVYYDEQFRLGLLVYSSCSGCGRIPSTEIYQLIKMAIQMAIVNNI